jgi:hypothetical protein
MPRMNGLSGFESADQYRQALENFRKRYVEDWKAWLDCGDKGINDKLKQFLEILKGWGICRCNLPGGVTAEFNEHKFSNLNGICGKLQDYDLRSFSGDKRVEECVWNIWSELEGICTNKSINIMIASKATMLLTNGSIGPAFDSTVMKRLGYTNNYKKDFDQWIKLLRTVAEDMLQFEKNIGNNIEQITPAPFNIIKLGRLYDMALGPRERDEGF